MLRAVPMLLALVAGTASAQRAPAMATLDRGDGISKVGVDAGASFVDEPYYLPLRLEIYGQYVGHSGFGLYGSLPLTSSNGAPSRDEDPNDLAPDDATTLANLELGGLYVASTAHDLSFVFRGGFSLPTAGKGADSRDARETLGAGFWPRATDVVNVTGALALRLGFSPMYYSHKVFLRADLGADLLQNLEPLLRFNVGAGVDLGPVALSLELVNIVAFIPDDDDNPGETQFLDSLAFAVRFMTNNVQPYLAVGVPLDKRSRDDLDLFIAGGLQFVP